MLSLEGTCAGPTKVVNVVNNSQIKHISDSTLVLKSGVLKSVVLKNSLYFYYNMFIHFSQRTHNTNLIGLLRVNSSKCVCSQR